MYLSNNISIRFIFLLLFFLELRFILSYSSNIYFFFIFFLVLYIFFSFFSKIISLYNINYEVRLVVYTLYNLFHFNKMKYCFILKWFYNNLWFRYYLYYYKLILINNIGNIYTNLNNFFIYVKHFFYTKIN